MSRPADRTTQTTWTAVEGPRMCANCGHNHWGWQSDSGGLAMAPQWGYCDDQSCPCRSLRPAAGVGVAPPTPLPDGERITDDNGDELEHGSDSEEPKGIDVDEWIPLLDSQDRPVVDPFADGQTIERGRE